MPGPSVFPSGEPGVWGTSGGRRKAVRDRLALQGVKLQYFGHLMQSQLIGKDSDAGRGWGQEEKGMTED